MSYYIRAGPALFTTAERGATLLRWTREPEKDKVSRRVLSLHTLPSRPITCCSLPMQRQHAHAEIYKLWASEEDSRVRASACVSFMESGRDVSRLLMGRLNDDGGIGRGLGFGGCDAWVNWPGYR